MNSCMVHEASHNSLSQIHLSVYTDIVNKWNKQCSGGFAWEILHTPSYCFQKSLVMLAKLLYLYSIYIGCNLLVEI